MIKDQKVLSISEISEYVSGADKKTENIRAFLKKFAKLNAKKVAELKKNIEALNLLKIKPEHIVKIADIVPEDKDELNKIFPDTSLDEDETKKILETIKNSI